MTPPSSKPAIQLHNLRQLQQDPHLSPTSSISNLVKQFATSTSKRSMNPDLSPPPNSTRRGEVLDASQALKSTHRQPHKRQVRRRLHTTRPYQHRLLNMAEARKEIVTALKFHRASLKQQQPKQQQQPCSHQDAGIMSHTNLVDDFSFSSFSHPALSLPNPFHWPTASPPQMPRNLSYNLPNRTLGLNLNFHDFDNLDAALYSYSSPSSSSPSLSVSTDHEVPSVAIPQGEGTSAPADAIDSIAATQVAMGDEGMAEIRSQGQRCQAEWNDTVNLLTSALWPKFAKNMEHHATEDDAAYAIFDGPVEFPDWLDANERCFEQCPQEFVLDHTLPCMDIGDFEGMGEEWLA